MRVFGAGVIGSGVWEGEAISNAELAARLAGLQPRLADPFRGFIDDEGKARVAGLMNLRPEAHPATIDILHHTITDPFRGAVSRQFIPEGTRVVDIEVEAAEKALSSAGISRSDVDVLLVQTLIPDELVKPDNSALIAHRLGITRALTWGLDTLCNSAISHIIAGLSLIASGAARYVLCVQSTAYSRVHDMAESASLTIGDGAAAFVLGPSDTNASMAWTTDGSLWPGIRLQHIKEEGYRGPNPKLIIEDEVGAGLMAKLAQQVTETCDSAMARAGLGYEDIDLFVCNQSTPWMPAYLSEVLGLPADALFHTYEEYGNVNGVGISASIHHARTRGLMDAGARALIFAAGGGSTTNAVVFDPA